MFADKDNRSDFLKSFMVHKANITYIISGASSPPARRSTIRLHHSKRGGQSNITHARISEPHHADERPDCCGLYRAITAPVWRASNWSCPSRRCLHLLLNSLPYNAPTFAKSFVDCVIRVFAEEQIVIRFAFKDYSD